MHKFRRSQSEQKYSIPCDDTEKKNNCSYLKANYAIVNIIRHKDVCIKYRRSLAVQTSPMQ